MATEQQLTPEQEIELLRKQLAEKDQVIAEKDAQEAELIQALKNAEAGKGSALPVVSHDGEQYRLLAAKANIKKVDYTAAQIEADPELIKYLVESGSGIIQKIEDSEEASND